MTRHPRELHVILRQTRLIGSACIALLVFLTLCSAVAYNKAVQERNRARLAECEILQTNRKAVLVLAHDLFIPIKPASNADEGLLQQIAELNALYAEQHAEIRELLRPFTCERIIP